MSKKTDLPYNMITIKRELRMMGLIFEGLLSFYVYVHQSLSEQLKRMSTASYLLFILYREHRTKFMPSHLCRDIVTSFIDALFCCTKSKENTPDEPLYLVRDGNDGLERFFGNIRMTFKGSNYNNLEMTNASRSMTECDRILVIDHHSSARNVMELDLEGYLLLIQMIWKGLT